MLEIIIICFVFWLGYKLGQSVTSYRLRDIIYEEAKRRGITTESDKKLFEATPKVLQLEVEQANGILYLYEKGTHNFICQATTIEELAVLAQKYKNVNYAAVITDDDVFAFVNGIVKSGKEVLSK